ncbi:MAG TPA: DUF2306 domain-containing protein [Steroidobacteraceae bacterium]|jgi:hypothetical protein|nr:DUF2306 domain-containing protein [Steroidobacteraceae bacterium]
MVNPNKSSKLPLLGWLLMTALGIAVAAYALGALAWPLVRSPVIVARLRTVPLPVVLHLIGGALAITLGALQLNSRIRRNHLAVHRWLGRCYCLAVLVGGSAGLTLATMADGGLPSSIGFGTLGVLWIGSTATAYICIRRRRVDLHRTWMLRSYGLTFAAVTLRIWLPLSQVAGLPFLPSYQAIAWLCWVPNLVVVEWFVLSRRVNT